ncbi:MAG: hypothetical protein C0404_00355 [Verrucomicrobia bacterium]|nr:hypothetical protein [Verrucomicrobiota bacterium]
MSNETASNLTSVPRTRFFDRVDWSAFWVTFILTLVGYTYTLAPTVSLEDSGELATAGAHLGIPHPPGYPIWTMIVWVFSRVFSFITYRGQPNPAWAIGFASAVFGALASALTALLVCRSGRDFLRQGRQDLPAINNFNEKLFGWVGGVSSSIVFAFTSINWSQSVIVEVYALNAFFLMLLMLLAYMWIKQPGHKLLVILSFVFGLGLTNYQAILLMMPAIVVLVMVKDLDLLRDFGIGAAPFALYFLLLKFDVISPIIHPLHYTAYMTVSANFLVLVAIYFLLPRGKTVALSILAFEVGLAFYGYMPLASDFNPPMNWGYPRTWDGFKHAISRGQYEKIVPTAFLSREFVIQLGDYFKDLRAQFTLPIALMGLLPFTTLGIMTRGRKIKVAFASLFIMGLAWVFIMLEDTIVGHAVQSENKYLSLPYLFMIVTLTMVAYAGACVFVADQVREFTDKLTRQAKSSLSDTAMVVLIFLAAGIGYIFWIYGLGTTLPAILQPILHPPPGTPAAPVDVGAVYGAALGIIALMIVPIGSLALSYWISYRTSNATKEVKPDEESGAVPEVAPETDADSRRWMMFLLASYVVMSVLFVLLASPKGDIQDYFIQRVKFISSHALFSILIGYGIIVSLYYGLSMVHALIKDNIAIWAATIVGCAFFLTYIPWIPIKENAYNKEQIRVVGGAEQNGHDFGWQFGNYQLRGAEAILEELSPDEEPIPNPEFPPEMDRDAIFYGGTDPGRFVPTYMIYSAHVREDVFLITQNALADNTYMSVMRDLYGDMIWIPAPPDSANAFQRYVEEVRGGKRQANADLKIEGGRVQVSGALGVMEINGILAQMIFEHNNWRHSFYVEESYVIRWMYAYLIPHGLIMKIEKNPSTLTDEIVRNDMEFWDWYSRRLVDDQKFIRDIVARKSFSKLRSAIGGLYANRGRPFEAEKAFQQARVLYPLSPEANFRLAQEVLLPMGRTDEALDLMGEFHDMDKGNKGVIGFTNQIADFRNVAKKVEEIEKKAAENKASLDEVVMLLELYLKVGHMQKFNTLASNLIATTNLPLQHVFRTAALLQRAGRIADMDKALDSCLAKFPENINPEVFLTGVKLYAMSNRPDKMRVWLHEYLKRRPLDWRAWFDMTTIELGMGKTNEASKSLEQAFRVGGEEAINTARQNPNFAPIIEKAAQKVQSSFSTPMSPMSVPAPGFTPQPSPLMPRPQPRIPMLPQN